MGEVQAVVEQYLVQAWRTAQVLLAQILGVAVQRLVALHFMAIGIAALQVVAQAVAVDHLLHLLLQVRRVSLQIA
ncbi:hypothetical protein D3C79_620110 [compost metagenome]